MNTPVASLPALLPCPFCGGDGLLAEVEPSGYVVECTNGTCNASTSIVFSCGEDSRPLVIAQWNRRALTPDVASLPANCRQRLMHEGKAYPRSGCAACGQWMPRAKECEAALAKPASGDGLPVAERICAIAKHSHYGKSLAAMLRDEVVIGDFREALVGLVHDMLRRLATPEQPGSSVQGEVVYRLGADGRLSREPALAPDMLALLDRARKEYRDSDAAGDVLDWLDEQYAITLIGQPTPTVKQDSGAARDCTCQRYDGRDCRRCFDPPYPDQQTTQPTTPPPAPAAEQGDRDAYEGAREDLLDWKRRAQMAEATLRSLGYTGITADEPPATQPEARGVEVLQRHMVTKYRDGSVRSEEVATPDPVRAEQPEGKWKLVPVELANQLQPGYWKEVYIGWRHMRVELTLQYDTWERLMKLLAAAPAAPAVGVDEAMVERAAEAYKAAAEDAGYTYNDDTLDEHRECTRAALTAALAPDGGEGE